MLYALVSPNETVPGGWRIAQVEPTMFEVSLPLVWHEVPDNVNTQDWIWNGTAAIVKPPKTKTMVTTPANKTVMKPPKSIS